MRVLQVADSADVQVAIEEKKKLLAEKEATLRRTLGRSKDTSLDPLDDSSLPRETKASQCIRWSFWDSCKHIPHTGAMSHCLHKQISHWPIDGRQIDHTTSS